MSRTFMQAQLHKIMVLGTHDSMQSLLCDSSNRSGSVDILVEVFREPAIWKEWGTRHIVLRQLAVSGQRVLRAHCKANGEASKANVPPGSFPFHNQISTIL
jgi:hypothetical protein